MVQTIRQIIPSVILKGVTTEEDKARVEPLEMLGVELCRLDEVDVDDTHRIQRLQEALRLLQIDLGLHVTQSHRSGVQGAYVSERHHRIGLKISHHPIKQAALLAEVEVDVLLLIQQATDAQYGVVVTVGAAVVEHLTAKLIDKRRMDAVFALALP